MTQEWFSPAELVALELPNLPGERGLQKRAKKENWLGRPREGKKGGGYEYHISSLPAKARKALQAKLATQLITTERAPAPHETKAIARAAQNLTGSQRACMEARAAFVGEVERMAAIQGRSKAVKTLAMMAKAGTLPDHLQALVPVANAKSGTRARAAQGCQSLSYRTLYGWVTDLEKGGVQALAPKVREKDFSVPA